MNGSLFSYYGGETVAQVSHHIHISPFYSLEVSQTHDTPTVRPQPPSQRSNNLNGKYPQSQSNQDNFFPRQGFPSSRQTKNFSSEANWIVNLIMFVQTVFLLLLGVVGCKCFRMENCISLGLFVIVLPYLTPHPPLSLSHRILNTTQCSNSNKW